MKRENQVLDLISGEAVCKKFIERTTSRHENEFGADSDIEFLKRHKDEWFEMLKRNLGRN